MLIQIIFSLSKSVLLSKLIFQLLMASLLVVLTLLLLLLLTKLIKKDQKETVLIGLNCSATKLQENNNYFNIVLDFEVAKSTVHQISSVLK